MAERTTSDKYTQARVVRDGVYYLVIDGAEKPIGTVAEVDGPRVLARLAAGRAEIAALSSEIARADEALSRGPDARAEAERLAAGVPALVAEAESSRQRTQEFLDRRRTLEARLAGLRAARP